MAKLSGPSLTRAVDWKIFEIQSRLVGEETVQADINDCIAWFQSRHYNEVIEERAADSRCGYPLCNKSLTIHANQQYRINYGDKEIYKVENSCYYCSNDCLVKSVTLEKALSIEMPTSRAISRSLDANSVKGNIDDLLGLFDSVSPSKKDSSKSPSKPTETETSDEPLPQYYNAKMSDEGRILAGNATEKPDKSTPSKESVPPITSTQAKDLLAKCESNNDTTPTKRKEKPTFSPKKSPSTAASTASNKREVIADAAATSAATADLSMDEILNKMRAIREGSSTNSTNTKPSPVKPVSAAANKADDDDDYDEVESSGEVRSVKGTITGVVNHKREQPWTDPVPGAKSKSVKWQDSNNNNSSTSNTGSNRATATGAGVAARPSGVMSRGVVENVTKMKVTERPTAPVPFTTAAGMKAAPSIMSKLGTVMERSNPQPMSLGAMMLKSETTTGTTTTVADGDNANDAAAAFSIEGYVAEMRSTMRVAPITTIKGLSYDPWQRTMNPTAGSTTAEEGEEVPVVEELADEPPSQSQQQQQKKQDGEEAGTDSDGNKDEEEEEEEGDEGVYEEENDVDDTGTDDAPPCSLFLSVWTALDDLFSNVAMDEVGNGGGVYGLPAVPPSAGSSNAGDGVMPARAPVAAEFLQVQSAILSLLERGIKAAERLLDVSKYVITKADVNIYHITKARFLNSVNCRLIKCPSLKSSGWTLIGVLLIDGILTRKSLLSEAYRGAVWASIVDSMAAAALGGGHIAGSQLRMDDLKILRSFFTDL